MPSLRLSASLSVLALGIAVLLAPAGRAQAPAAPPTQLDRIETKLDEILRRLDARQDRPASRAAAAATPETAGSAPVDTADKPGALVVVRPAPPLSNILTPSPDSVGGFVHDGGPVRLDDLAAKGVRYRDQVGVEFQGWLRVKDTGRYQLGAEFGPSRPGAGGDFSCGVALWLEDRPIGQQSGQLSLSGPNPVPLALVLGAELQPGFYKLRLWTACGRMYGSVPVSATVIIKAPSDLNLRSLTPGDIVHREG